MPVVRVDLILGYDSDTKRRLGQALTAAVRATIDAPLDGITVVMEEADPDAYLRGGQCRQPGPVKPDPAERVRTFLEAMAARDFAVARTYVADGFRMVFPGGVAMTRFEELSAWAAARYQRIAKTIDGIEICPGLDNQVVWCFGTLSGAWLDGTHFAGIRFTDRFVLCNDLIVEQQVWNDLAETSRSVTV